MQCAKLIAIRNRLDAFSALFLLFPTWPRRRGAGFTVLSTVSQVNSPPIDTSQLPYPPVSLYGGGDMPTMVSSHTRLSFGRSDASSSAHISTICSTVHPIRHSWAKQDLSTILRRHSDYPPSPKRRRETRRFCISSDLNNLGPSAYCASRIYRSARFRYCSSVSYGGRDQSSRYRLGLYHPVDAGNFPRLVKFRASATYRYRTARRIF